MNDTTKNTGSQGAPETLWPHPYDAAVSNGTFHIGQIGHTLTTLGSHTGHTAVPVAFCARESVARLLLDAVMQRGDLLAALDKIADHYDQDGYGYEAWKKLALEMADVASQARAKARGAA